MLIWSVWEQGCSPHGIRKANRGRNPSISFKGMILIISFLQTKGGTLPSNSLYWGQRPYDTGLWRKFVLCIYPVTMGLMTNYEDMECVGAKIEDIKKYHQVQHIVNHHFRVSS